MKASLLLLLVLAHTSLSTTNGSSSRESPPRVSRQSSSVQREKEQNNNALQLPTLRWKRPKWLSNRRFGFVKDGDFSAAASKAMTYCQYGVIAYLVAALCKDLVSTIRDLNNEFSSNSQNALSRSEVKDLIAWIEKSQVAITPKPPLSLPWLASIALNLYEQAGLSIQQLEHIVMQLTVDQANMLHDCLLQSDRKTTFDSVGGLGAIKQNINDWVSFNARAQRGAVTPYDSFVKSGRQGLALWGPPGCGKSLLMKAITNKSNLPTLVVTPSLMQKKYYGESTMRVRSLFSLVSLLGPCIVVLDELDGLFKLRNSEEIEVSRDMKTEWLQWWDGVASDQINNPKVMFIGATNRPWDCDPAVWRRLPQRHYVGVPTYDDRLDLFLKWMVGHKLPPIEREVLEYFAGQTEGYIPSDLYHILQSACRKGPMERLDETLTMIDVQKALVEVPPTRFTMDYVKQVEGFLSPHVPQQHQNAQGVSTDPNGGSYFETPAGTYYQFQIPVEPSNVMNEMLWNENQNDFASDSEDFDSDDFITDSDIDEL
ncbi:unnamed protein product [Cylindrotheca closterium]|uniref:AAA+ ATPase domain-containing protein n=1 Tax=Cylindrotheca closterium TaxID=2856 RepID=A0AAD2CXU2_9STRA|nr:unnamed protein product [Cylindrotheca closterium]